MVKIFLDMVNIFVNPPNRFRKENNMTIQNLSKKDTQDIRDRYLKTYAECNAIWAQHPPLNGLLTWLGILFTTNRKSL